MTIIKQEQRLVDILKSLISLSMNEPNQNTIQNCNLLDLHHLGVSDDIQLRILAYELLVTQKLDLWQLVTVTEQIERNILSVPRSFKAQYFIILTYLDKFSNLLSTLIACNGYLKVAQVLQHGFPANLPEFFLDTSLLPIENLCGYQAYHNPILAIVFQQNEMDYDFQLYDSMCQESFETKENLFSTCLTLYHENSIEVLNEFINYLALFQGQKLAYSNFYSFYYYNDCIKIKEHFVKKGSIKKRSRNHSTPSDGYEYFGHIKN